MSRPNGRHGNGATVKGASRSLGARDGAAPPTRGVAVLGSTGSIGTTALRVLERQRGAFHVEALTAYENATLLEAQARAFGSPYVGLVVDGQQPHPLDWETGVECLVAACTLDGVDIVLNAVVGAAGSMRRLPDCAQGNESHWRTRKRWSSPASWSRRRRWPAAARSCPSTVNTRPFCSALALDPHQKSVDFC